MKNIALALLVLTSFITISCNPNNPQPNTSSTNPTWRIVAKINGVTHRAEGNSLNVNTNYCVASISTDWIISAGIADKTASSYISGDNGTLQFLISNPSLGINPLSNCTVFGSWFTDVIEHSGYGYSLTLNGPMVTNSTGGLGPRLPITLTSLGSAGNGAYNNSQPVKGSYSGILYFQSSPPASGFDTPVTIDLEFEALRP